MDKPKPMDVDRFWNIIGQAGEKQDAKGSIATSLAGELQSCNPQEILQFGHMFSQYNFMADTWLMWSAANLFAGNLSDDGFMDFRSWLVGRGREVYQKVMANPDSLADYDRDMMPSDESAMYAASTAYDAMREPGSPDYYDSLSTVSLSPEQMQEIQGSVQPHPQLNYRVESIEDAQSLLPRCNAKFSSPNHDYNTWLHPVDYHDRAYDLS